MKYKKESWNHERLEDILTPEQEEVLQKWLEVNGLEYAEYQDDLLNGVTVYSEDHSANKESWAIDFVRKQVV